MSLRYIPEMLVKERKLKKKEDWEKVIVGMVENWMLQSHEKNW